MKRRIKVTESQLADIIAVSTMKKPITGIYSLRQEELYDDNGLAYTDQEKEFPPARTRSNPTQDVNEGNTLNGGNIKGTVGMEELDEYKSGPTPKSTDQKGGCEKEMSCAPGHTWSQRHCNCMTYDEISGPYFE
tara:strand:- start:592 stop:993 length:402 start_codon:yes stop_codon:yes gene_type:complete